MPRISTYTIRIMGPGRQDYESTKDFDEKNQEVVDNLGSALVHAEDAINDNLPDGFYCKIDDA